MARTVRNSKIDSRTARARLPVRKSVYWVNVSRGFALGYRKGTKGGVWLAKLVRDGERDESTLGTADDVLDADGRAILDYSQAQDKARSWIKALANKNDGEPISVSYTVGNALTDYLKDYKRRGGKSYVDTKARIDALINPDLGKLLLSKLTKRRVRDWHAQFAEQGARLRTKKGKDQKLREFDADDSETVRKRRATANRLLNILKAALNYAATEGKIDNDTAWRHVKPFKGVDVAKIRYLSLEECKNLVNKTEESFRPMVQAALLGGCRYGELSALVCEDFDHSAGTLHVRQSKSGKARHVVMTDDGIAFLKKVIDKRPGNDLIFKRPDGNAWGKSHQHRPIKDACKEAKISPAVSFHILRHTYASHLVMAGASLQVVAANLGHADTRMTERHYAHLAPSHVATVIRAAMPKMNIFEQGNGTAKAA